MNNKNNWEDNSSFEKGAAASSSREEEEDKTAKLVQEELLSKNSLHTAVRNAAGVGSSAGGGGRSASAGVSQKKYAEEIGAKFGEDPNFLTSCSSPDVGSVPAVPRTASSASSRQASHRTVPIDGMTSIPADLFRRLEAAANTDRGVRIFLSRCW